jgi:hypothetical protein
MYIFRVRPSGKRVHCLLLILNYLKLFYDDTTNNSGNLVVCLMELHVTGYKVTLFFGGNRLV